MSKSPESIHPDLHRSTIARAIALLFVSAPCFAQSQANVGLDAITVTAKARPKVESVEVAPSQVSLDVATPMSIVSEHFIRNFVSPVADYTQAVSMTPGAFGYSPNGVGLGDTKVTIRGLSDSNFNITFDGIPFNDTNGVSHHSWVFFPSQFLGGAVVDRSPGSASSIGQATYGGTIDFQSRRLSPERRATATASYGTWGTKLLNLEYETGQFGANGESSLMFNVHEMKSNGYQTFNFQDRIGLSTKYQRAISADTTLTVFASLIDLKSNTPAIKGVSRANVNAGAYNAMLSDDPTKPNYYKFNFYDAPTAFMYAGVTSNLGGGWKLDNKTYRYDYHNKQNYNNSATTISATSAVDKLNAYTTVGNITRVSRDSDLGTLRFGLWIDYADSHRFQTPSDPRTWVSVQTPNFFEKYKTTTIQPFVEYEFKVSDKLKVTPGLKYASYHQDFTHMADNGGAVGPLGGTFSSSTNVITGGAGNLRNSVTYSDLLPSLSAHYRVAPNWSTYAQYAYGDSIPSTSVFDVKNAQVTPVPKAQKAKAAQIGTVWTSPKLTLAADIYNIRLDGAYTATAPDSAGNVGYFLSGTQTSQGVEGEVSYVLGAGFSLYGNATMGSVKYASGQWVAGAPRDTEKLALNYGNNAWDASLQLQRIGKMYNDGKAAGSYEAFKIDSVLLTNMFVNYTFKTPGSFAKQTRLQLGVNNLFNKHNIVGIASPVAGSSSANPSTADLLTMLPARSVNLTAVISF